MWGAHDRVVPVKHLELVRRHLPNAQTYVFPDAGHVPMLECPDEFNRVAVAFLQRASGGNGRSVAAGADPV
jgi:pimeloyl-ACP methyl ester carboxylesterase